MIDIKKLACGLVAEGIVEFSKLNSLVEYLESKSEEKSIILDIQSFQEEMKKSETGIWRCYGSFENIPVKTNSVVGTIFFESVDGKETVKVCDFNFGDKGEFQKSNILKNHIVLDGLLCPNSGLIFIKWNNDPGDQTIINIHHYEQIITKEV